MDIYGSYYFSKSLFDCWRIYCKNCCRCLWSLPSSFHCKSTSKPLKNSQRKLIWKLIILLDFAENDSFVVQDVVQGFHWEISQATLYPFVAYLRSSNWDFKDTSICIISDCLKHDQTAVHCFLTKVITLMEQKVNNIKIIHY